MVEAEAAKGDYFGKGLAIGQRYLDIPLNNTEPIMEQNSTESNQSPHRAVNSRDVNEHVVNRSLRRSQMTTSTTSKP